MGEGQDHSSAWEWRWEKGRGCNQAFLGLPSVFADGDSHKTLAERASQILSHFGASPNLVATMDSICFHLRGLSGMTREKGRCQSCS